MLINFSFSNYKSFGEEANLSMIAGKSRKHSSHIHKVKESPIIKYAAIYGSNAAGKTSLVSAINDSHKFILNKILLIELKNNWCRCDDKYISEPSTFEYTFENNGRIFQYGFDLLLNESKIFNEWLYEITDSKETLIFTRELKKENYEYTFANFQEQTKTRLHIYSDDFSSNEDRLFLRYISTKKIDEDSDLNIFKLVMYWFKNKLVVNESKIPDEQSLRIASEYLGSYDTSIASIVYEEVENPNKYISEKMLKQWDNILLAPDFTKYVLKDDKVKAFKLKIMHKSGKYFNFDEESTGTCEAFELVSTLYSEHAKNVTFIMDEFGHFMHQLLSKKVVTDFIDHNTNGTNQLIVATHHTSILSTDIFRRDEIYFVDKKDEISELYSLEEFEDIFDNELSKRYYEGRFGALPIFTEKNNFEDE